MKESIKSKQTFLITYTVLMVIAALVATFFNFKPYGNVAFKAGKDTPKGYTPCEMVFNIDENYLLTMTFLMPYKNRHQEKKMKKMIPQIQNAIIQKMDGSKASMIRSGELGKFKEELVAIINKEMDTSLEDIYFDRVNLY